MTKDEYIKQVQAFGQTDDNYLEWHADRFLITKAIVDNRLRLQAARAIFDIGAHWLHQAYLYGVDGHQVIATDVGGVLAVQSVQALARENGIQIQQSAGFDRQGAFADVADNSIDIVLFTEILEHITFNPVELWQEIHRLMKPDAVIVITTPNYYFWQSRAWAFSRFIKRMGGGIPVADIIKQVTYGHHWKEYSAREIVRYFELLPIPLYVDHAEYLSFNTAHRLRVPKWTTSLFHKLEKQLPILRDSIYLEVRRCMPHNKSTSQ